MKYTVLLIPILFFVITCSKNDTVIRTSDMTVPNITGFELRNEVGTITKIIGVPNNELNDEETGFNFTFYPNPASEIGRLHFNSAGNDKLKQIWMVQAQYDNPIPDYAIENGMLVYRVGGAPLISLETTADNFFIDLKDFTNGYYRMYVKIGDILLYDNIIIYK